MAVNGVEIEVGQSWRTRDGVLVTIVEPEHVSEKYPIVATDDAGRFITYSLNGEYSTQGATCHDLIELVAPAKVEAVATPVVTPEPYGMVEWAGGEQPAETQGRKVKVQYRSGVRVDNLPADSLGWLHAGVNGDIIGYRVQKTRKVDTAPDLLDKAAGHMRERAATYDSPGGERSMAKTVALFNLHHEMALTEAQGWHFMQILKDVRLFSAKGYHADSAEDKIAYAALMSEAKAKEGV